MRLNEAYLDSLLDDSDPESAEDAPDRSAPHPAYASASKPLATSLSLKGDR
jgi:hypothetical protein